MWFRRVGFRIDRSSWARKVRLLARYYSSVDSFRARLLLQYFEPRNLWLEALFLYYVDTLSLRVQGVHHHKETHPYTAYTS